MSGHTNGVLGGPNIQQRVLNTVAALGLPADISLEAADNVLSALGFPTASETFGLRAPTFLEAIGLGETFQPVGRLRVEGDRTMPPIKRRPDIPVPFVVIGPAQIREQMEAGTFLPRNGVAERNGVVPPPAPPVQMFGVEFIGEKDLIIGPGGGFIPVPPARGPVINLPPGVEFKDVVVISQRFPVGNSVGFIADGMTLLPEI